MSQVTPHPATSRHIPIGHRSAHICLIEQQKRRTHMPNAHDILESSISTAMARLDERRAARATLPVYAAPARYIPSDEDMFSLIQARRRAAARRERAARRATARDVHYCLLVSRADILRRARALHDVSTFTWSERMKWAWYEGKLRQFNNWGWLSDHHQAAADLTRRLISLELAAAQEPELAQIGARRNPDLHRDEIARLRASLSIVVGQIVSQKDRAQ
jgi:hypothetical protein